MPLSPVRFQDAGFRHRFAWCRSPLEGDSLRWIPFGMPRLHPDFERVAFYLFERTPKGIQGPKGTGVLIALPGVMGLARHLYAVTCAHVAPDGASIIRINTKGGKSRWLEFEPHEWEFISGGHDVAAIDVTDRVDFETDDIKCILTTQFASEGFAKHVQLGLGEDVFMLGLFADQVGKDRNLFASRFGNIAMLATSDAPVEQPNGSVLPSHIMDMRSRTGFSGSPVFVFRTPDGDLREASAAFNHTSAATLTKHPVQGRQSAHRYTGLYVELPRGPLYTSDNIFVSLLGIHCGQYPEQVTARKARRPRGEDNDIIRDRDMIKIPSSMTIVVPVDAISVLLGLPVFKQQRQERDMRLQNEREKRNAPEAESIKEDRVEPEADNPQHKEDFTSLLGRASKASKSGGRT